MKKFLIQLTGAQGTGKTTILKALREKYSDKVFFIGEATRNLTAARVIDKRDVNASLVEQLIINAELELQYLEGLASSHNIIFAERTPICCLAYSRAIVQLAYNEDRYKYVEEATVRFLKSICFSDFLDACTLYVPPLIPFVEDNFRFRESQYIIDKHIAMILKDFNISYFPIFSNAIEDRICYVDALIKNRL